MNRTFKRLVMASAITSVIAGVSPVMAQENTEGEQLEEVVVTAKFLKSLQNAMEQKRNSASVIEAISAEDIGQLPDVAITETLARLPGLAQDRDRGNGSQISIRGMGGLLGLTTLNGREVATVEEDRNVRYDQFPSELINSAQVYKTPQARLSEGGLSGTVNLDTLKPLDHDKRVVALGARGSYYELANEIDDASGDGYGGRISASYIDQFMDDRLGIALGYAGRKQPIATQRTELWNYGDTWHNTQWNGDTEYVAPWGGQALVRGGEDKRNGYIGVIQWIPNEHLDVSYDFFYSDYEIDEQQRGFDFSIINWTDPWEVLEAADSQYSNVSDGAQDVLSATVPVSFRTLNETFEQSDTLVSHGLQLKWHADQWTIASDLAYSATERDRRWTSIRTSNSTANQTATFSTDSDGRMYIEPGAGIDLTDPNQNNIESITVQPDAHSEDEILSLQLDFSREIDSGFITSVDFGIRYSEREKFLNAQIWDQYVTSHYGEPVPASLLNNASSDSYWDGLPAYLTYDSAAVADYYFGGISNPTPNDNDDLLASWNVEETISAQYIQLNFETEFNGIPVTGNIGIRAAQTETTSSGYQLLIADDYDDSTIEMVEAINVDHRYNDVLPSLNVTFGLTDDQLLRFGASKTIARAPVDFLSPSVDINVDRWGSNPGESSSGNPKLDPFRATQADLSYEWYFNDKSQFSLALYYKDLDTFIARSADAYNLTIDDVTYSISTPVNGSGGYIRGYEVVYQQAFDFLPQPFDGLGVYANYANTQSNVTQYVPANSTPSGLTGLSEHVANVTLWYYLSGFEARVAYNYRSEFQRDVNRVQGEEGINSDEGYVDLSLSYEVNDNYKVSFQVQNLTDEPYKVYGLESNNPNHINRYEEFGRRFSLGINWSL
ncbi:MAG: TonB-dependent receptor [Spongiibacteraceae bacterium]|nr:TonB-dependent receptor [Spongiibacteraceae bacterium]